MILNKLYNYIKMFNGAVLIRINHLKMKFLLDLIN